MYSVYIYIYFLVINACVTIATTIFIIIIVYLLLLEYRQQYS